MFLLCDIFRIFIENNSSSDDEPLAKRQRKELPKILDGTYFRVKEFLAPPKLKAECMTCGRIRAAATNGTGNLTQHFKDSHPTLIHNLMEHIRKRDETILFEEQKKLSILKFEATPEVVCIQFDSQLN